METQSQIPKYFNSNQQFRDGKSPDALQMNRIAPQNIVMRLSAREMWGGRRSGCEKYVQRSMYQSIFPNFTISHVDKPPCFLRKFTPDGKHFIAFSSDQMSVEVYSFRGPQAAGHLFQSDGDKLPSWFKPKGNKSSGDKKPVDHISPDENDKENQDIRRNIFNCFFKLKFRVRVASPGSLLNRECSLFTHDSRYIIVGSATYIDDNAHPHFHDMYRNNESVEPNPRFPLEDYNIHLVDLVDGLLTDSKSFKVDKIYLSHNQGMYLYNSTLAVLSVQHQTIYIFHITEHGRFQEVRTIGRFCFEDDELITTSPAPTTFGLVTPFEEAFINSLKHRLLVHIYRHTLTPAVDMRNYDDNNDVDGCGNKRFPLRTRFYQYFEQFWKLRIWKMQLLDENHLLLKYSNEDVVTLKSSEPNSQHCLFAVYDILNTDVIAVFENTSDEFVDIFESFTDNFRNNFLTQESRYSSSPSNNIFSKQIHQRFRQTITSARFGGPVEATKRILAQLPISAQSFSSSPYLDQALFSYDDHRVSIMERPKALPENGIKFYGRDSGIYKFQIHAGYLTPPRGNSQSGRRLVSFTFHPHAPFAISVQRQNAEYLVHFHIRLDQQSIPPYI